MKLEEPMRRALTLEVGMQNAGLGATLATMLFRDQPGVAIAPAMYTFGCMLTGTMLANYWARRSSGSLPREKPDESKP
jgi:BASS family bile acid:Na+ symporter